jgi:hypothetical protein
MEPERFDYASPDLPGHARRTLSQWMVLLVAWCVGLVVWAVYAVVIGLVMIRLL